MNVMESFPFDEPRERQVDFVETMISDLERDGLSVSIAPNGFGKTSCALTAAVAAGFKRIYYSTRTHKQIKHVITTVKKMNEKRGGTVLSAIELSGRERACLNSNVISFMGSDVLTTCVSSRDGDFCKVGRKKSSWLRIVKNGVGMDAIKAPAVDGKDINTTCVEAGICPYYLSLSVHNNFNVVACSYNHVFDPVVREAVGINLDGALVICDEAHNIVEALESFLTKELSTKMLEKAKSLPIKYSPDSIVVLRKLDSMMASADRFIKTGKDSFAKVEDCNEFLDKNGFTRKWMGRAIRCLKKDDGGNGFLVDIISFLHSLRTDTGRMMHSFTSGRGRMKKRVLRVASMDVKKLVDNVIAGGSKIAFMSGTLSKQFFEKRVGIKMERMRDYNLYKRNLSVYISEMIPATYKKLSSYYQVREDLDVLNGFGYYLSKIAPEIKRGGIIVFFPSYGFMKNVVGAWEMRGYVHYNDDIERCFFADGEEILLFMEKRDDKSKKAINDFKAKATDGKAMLLSVFRGGASEGEDFPGDQCNAVFCMGIPLRNVKAGSTMMKMEYYDGIKKGYGFYWLRVDAMMAVSQAIGRGIRDPSRDKAVAVLLGSRYNKSDYSSLLCDWIRECISMKGRGINAIKIRDDVRRFIGTR